MQKKRVPRKTLFERQRRTDPSNTSSTMRTLKRHIFGESLHALLILWRCLWLLVLWRLHLLELLRLRLRWLWLLRLLVLRCRLVLLPLGFRLRSEHEVLHEEDDGGAVMSRIVLPTLLLRLRRDYQQLPLNGVVPEILGLLPVRTEVEERRLFDIVSVSPLLGVVYRKREFCRNRSIRQGPHFGWSCQSALDCAEVKVSHFFAPCRIPDCM